MFAGCYFLTSNYFTQIINYRILGIKKGVSFETPFIIC